MNKPIIAVAGATGNQGGAVVRALLAENKFQVRGLTRNLDSDKAAALAKLGVEVVTANLDDPESLKSAFTGAYGVYAVTTYYEHFSPEQERQQLENVAEAAKSAGVQHVVASVLEDTRKYVKEGTMPKLLDKYYVPHFDGKGEAIEKLLSTCPCTPLITSAYYENFLNVLKPQTSPDGSLAFTIPMGDQPLCMQSVADIGKFVAYLFNHKDYISKVVGLEAERMPMSEVAQLFTKVLAKTTVYNSVEPSAFAAMGFPGAEDLANMFQYFRDYAKEAAELRVEGRKALTDLISLEAWLAENKGHFA